MGSFRLTRADRGAVFAFVDVAALKAMAGRSVAATGREASEGEAGAGIRQRFLQFSAIRIIGMQNGPL